MVGRMNNKRGINFTLNEMHNKLKEIRDAVIHKGFLHLLFSNALTSLLGFIAQLFVAYILLPEDIGRIKFLQVFVLAGGIVSGLGFNTAVQKLCSEKRAEGEKAFILRKAIKYSLIASVVVYVIVLFCSTFNLFSNDSVINKVIPVYSIVLLPQTIYMLLMSYLEAKKMVKSLSKIQAITKLLSLILIIIPTFYFLFIGYVIGYITGLVITAFIFYTYVSKSLRQINPVPVSDPFSLQWYYAKYSLLINVLNVINLNADIFLINYLLIDRTIIGYYSFAATLLVSLYLITTTIQQITTPYFSERAGSFEEWARIFKKYNRLQNIFAFITMVISLAVGPFLIRVLFEGKYDSSIPFFIMLVFGWFIRNLYTLKVVAIFGSGKIELNFKAFFLSTILGLLITYFLIVYIGIYGAGYANITVGFFTSLLISFYFRKFRAQEIRSSFNE